jgi:hypothetical protein
VEGLGVVYGLDLQLEEHNIQQKYFHCMHTHMVMLLKPAQTKGWFNSITQPASLHSSRGDTFKQTIATTQTFSDQNK